MKMDDYILEWLEDTFGHPCEYEFNEENAMEVEDAE